MDSNPSTRLVGGIQPQTRQVLENMKNIIEAGGSDMSKVVKCTILLADMSLFAQVTTYDGNYNHDIRTLLVLSYPSYPSILGISSNIFYHIPIHCLYFINFMLFVYKHNCLCTCTCR